MNRPTSLTSWVSIPRPNPAARLRLFCFPYAGAGASVFYSWATGLPTEVEVCAVQPPGREARLREAPYTDMLALVDALGDALAPHMEDRPFAFFGHSNGAIMAFELARKLRREGRRMPLHLFLSGRPAAQLPSRHPVIHALPEPQFIAELRRLQGTPEEVLNHPEIMELLVPLLRADFSLAETYVHRAEAPLDVPISAYGGLRDPDVNEDEVEGWGAQTAAAFRSVLFPGDHFFLNGDRAQLLAQLSGELRGVVAHAAGAPVHA